MARPPRHPRAGSRANVPSPTARTFAGRVRRSDGRAVAAILLGLAAVVAAIVAARGPAISEQAEYTWPPTELPGATPTRTWFTPMLLARYTAKSIDARVPCGDEQTLGQAGRSVVVLSTARDPQRSHALEVVRSAGSGTTLVRVGRVELARLVPRADRECSLRVRFDGGAWTISREGGPTRKGTLREPPTVYGLISELDLRAAPQLHVSIRPFPQDTRPSARQTAFRILSALLIAIAVLFVLATGEPRRWIRRPQAPRVAVQDGVVGLTLVAWWLLAPLYFDDGWVRARQTNSLASGGFSNYYEPWGANLPMATWLEWLQHFVVGNTSSLALHRLLSVLVLLATWLLCRVCLFRLIGRRPGIGDAAWWSASLAFAVGVAAFGVTLRPEPVISLMAVAALACCLSYLDAPRLEPVVFTALLGGLALTIHPTGAIVLAPLAVCAPRVIRDARGGRISRLRLAAVLPVAAAWVLLLAFLDSDISSRRESASLFRSGGEHAGGVLQELDRYAELSNVGASPLRRVVVLLLALSTVALIAGLLTKRSLRDRLAAASVLLGLVALAFAPSKWIWHFGALVGLCAVSVGFETFRLQAIRLSAFGRWLVTSALFLAVVWAARRPAVWGPLDTGRLNWIYLATPYVATTLLAFAGLVVATKMRWVERPHAAVLPVLLASLLGTTTLMLAADAGVTRGWTAARQVLGIDTCGVASDLVVEVPRPIRELTRAEAAVVQRRVTYADAGISDPVARGGIGETVWYRVPSAPVGVFVGPVRLVDKLRVTCGRRTSSGIRRLRSDPGQLWQVTHGHATWGFVAEESFPTRPAGADSIRLELIGVKGLRSTATVSHPVTYRQSRLSSIVGRRDTASFVSPFLFEAMPCATLPTLAYGVAQTPEVLVDFGPYTSLGPASLYFGVSKVFDVRRIPQAASSSKPFVYVYFVRTDHRDGQAPAVRTILRD